MTKMLDVSHHNGTINWPGTFAKGFLGAYVKCTEGTSYIDTQFYNNWHLSKEAGLQVGAYHFFHPDIDPKAQADHFLKVMGPNLSGRLPAVLDWEVTGNMRNSVQLDRALTFLSYVKSATNKAPIIYTGPAFMDALGNPSALAAYPLWIAHYGVSHPRVPKPWKDYLIWQTSDANGLDLDTFNGDINALKALAV